MKILKVILCFSALVILSTNSAIAAIDQYIADNPVAVIPGLGSATDISGNNYNSNTNTIFLIANKNNLMWEVDINFNVLRTINVSLAGTGLNSFDSEDIVWLGGNEYAIVEERESKLYIGTIPPAVTSINLSSFQVVTFNAPGNNSGYEGVTFNPATNRFWIIKEKSPKAILSFIRPTTSSDIDITGATTTPFDATALPVSDISSIQFDTRNSDGNLLILSHASSTLLEVNATTGSVCAECTLALPTGNQFEGVTLGPGLDIIVTSEPNLYQVYSITSFDTIFKNDFE